jgi:death-on-curing protein
VKRLQDVFDQAAVALYRIASGHPFSDGNKRTAVLLGELILNQQGFKLKANPDVAVKLLLKIASGKMSLVEVKDWVRKHAVRL